MTGAGENLGTLDIPKLAGHRLLCGLFVAILQVLESGTDLSGETTCDLFAVQVRHRQPFEFSPNSNLWRRLRFLIRRDRPRHDTKPRRRRPIGVTGRFPVVMIPTHVSHLSSANASPLEPSWPS